MKATKGTRYVWELRVKISLPTFRTEQKNRKEKGIGKLPDRGDNSFYIFYRPAYLQSSEN